MLQPRGKGIVGDALRYKNEVRDEDKYFDEIPAVKVSKDMLELAEHILKSKKAKFDPHEIRGPLRGRAEQADQAKRAGKKPPTAAGAEAEQRHQSDGRAAAQREGGKGSARREGAPAQAPLEADAISASGHPKRKKLKRAS